MLVIAGKGPAFEEICGTTKCERVPNGSPLRPGDVLLSVQYDRIIRNDDLGRYKHAVNLHFGPLPQLRGCFPTKWAIINGEPAGVTLHHMTSGIDDGPILSRWEFPSGSLTDGEVYEKCNRVAVHLFNYWRERLLAGDLPAGVPQDHTRAKYYPRVLPFDGKRRKVPGPLMERAERAFTHPGYPPLL